MVSVQYNVGVLPAQRNYGSSERKQMRDRARIYKRPIHAALQWARIQAIKDTHSGK